MTDETKYVVWDVEADGLNPTKIYCLSYRDFEDNKGTLTDYGDIREFFKKYELYICHNGRRWDLVHLKRLCDIEEPKRFVDTLFLSWALDPERKKHGLEEYGEEFGIQKPIIVNWHNQTLESYIFRCEQDVEINFTLWLNQLNYLLRLYDDPQDIWNYLKYLDFKAIMAQVQEKSGWKLDIEKAQENLKILEDLQSDKLERLTEAMPPVPIVKEYNKPKKCRNSDGQLSVLGQRWADLLVREGFDPEYDGVVSLVVGHDPGNPNSPEQVKSWLYSLGWVPQTIKFQRDKKTGNVKEIPQINKEKSKGEGVCNSVLALFEKEPSLEHLDNLYVLKHRIGLLKGFLRDVDEEGYLHARVAGLTNTLRFKHAEIVNLPKPEKSFGEYIRSCLVAPDGTELCGSDMSGLEDKLKQHFIYPYDPEYVHELNTPDYDPHLDISVLSGSLSQEDADFYKKVNPLLEKNLEVSEEDKKRIKRIKPIRSINKNGNYALQYLCGVARLMITCGIDRPAAKNLYDTYWRRNWAIKAVAEDQVIKVLDDRMWLWNPISNFWYSLRNDKDIFSTLVQGSASFCFDLWGKKIYERRPQFTGQFHDEYVFVLPLGYREEMTSLLEEAIIEVNDILRLNRELGITIQFDNRYSEIH